MKRLEYLEIRMDQYERPISRSAVMMEGQFIVAFLRKEDRLDELESEKSLEEWKEISRESHGIH